MRIGFIGLGHMGFPMASNLVKAGHTVHGLDLNHEALAAFEAAGGKRAGSIKELAVTMDVLFSMLPEGKHVRGVYFGPEGVFENAHPALKIAECSTTDIETTQSLHKEADLRNLSLLDAPVSGGVKAAAEGTLTFMVGGEETTFHTFEPLLSSMGKRIVHCGAAGTGQAAKICNNMVLGISMIGTCEAFLLAEKLGLSSEKFYEVASGSSAQSWSLTSYCPVPGPVSTSPANRDYAPGFTAAMMLKDLRLAVEAAAQVGQGVAMGDEARSLYEQFCESSGATKDFSGIIKWLNRT